MSTTDKPVSQWTYDDLVTHAVWELVQGIVRGRELRMIVQSILTMHANWVAKEKELS